MEIFGIWLEFPNVSLIDIYREEKNEWKEKRTQGWALRDSNVKCEKSDRWVSKAAWEENEND